MAKTGAKGKYTPEIVNDLCNLIKEGLTDKDASGSVGINPDTFYTWLKKPEFYEAIKKAEALSKASLVQKIRKDPSWQSAAWLLERRFRDEYAPPARYEITGRDGQPLTLNVISTFMYDGKLNTSKLRGDVFPPDRSIEGPAQV